jgi:hypothetical protein
MLRYMRTASPALPASEQAGRSAAGRGPAPQDPWPLSGKAGRNFTDERLMIPKGVFRCGDLVLQSSR